MKKYLFLLFCSLMVFVSACQANPEESIVANKGDDDLEKIISEMPDADFLKDIPADLQETINFDDNKMIVNIDAIVEIPEINRIPVVKMVPRKITQDEIDTIINTLMQNKPLFHPRSLEDYTKEEIAEIIVKLKSGQGSDLYELDPDAYLDAIQDDIEMYEQLYKNAPDEYVKKPANTELVPSTEEEGLTTLTVTADLGKAEPAYFSYVDKNTQFVTFGFYNVEGRPPNGKVTANLDVPGLNISVESAQEIAESTVDQLGIGDFSVNGVGTVPNRKSDVVPPGARYEDSPKCYIFYFTRRINGLNETYVNPSYVNNFSQKNPEMQYNFVWPCEVIAVTADDNGIPSVVYTGPAPDMEVINETVPIKDFNEIMDVFKKQISIEGAFMQNENIIETKIEIERIVLGGMKIINKDSAGEYLFVPVWDFFGRVTSKYKPGTGDQGQLGDDNEWVDDGYGYSIMTINAVDGSIINRSIGY